MTQTKLSGRTAQAVINRVKRNGFVVTKIKKTHEKHFHGYNGMNLYSVCYHKKRR